MPNLYVAMSPLTAFSQPAPRPEPSKRWQAVRDKISRAARDTSMDLRGGVSDLLVSTICAIETGPLALELMTDEQVANLVERAYICWEAAWRYAGCDEADDSIEVADRALKSFIKQELGD